MSKFKNIKAVLFDLDGVLVDACDWHYHALNMSLEKHAGFKIEKKDHIDNFNGLPTIKKLKMLEKKKMLKEENFEKIWKDKQKLIKSKLDVCCVTNSIRKTAELMLKKTGQIKFMKFIITNEDVVNPKPDPECYISAIAKLNLDKENVLIIEDSEKGYAAAVQSGANVIKVKNPNEVNIDLFKKVGII